MPVRSLTDHIETAYRDIRMGLEVEYPLAQSGGTTMRLPAVDSTDARPGGFPSDADNGTDPTVGREVRTTGSGAPFERMADWYEEVIETFVDGGYPFEPTGLLTGSTAGLHTHISPLTEEEARTLYDWSQEDWMKLFVCSSITADPNVFAVFRSEVRGNYCRFRGYDSGRYAAVHRASPADGHYEWRLPEPMTVEHYDLYYEFLDRFLNGDDREDAREFARGLVLDGDERLTSIQRAQEVGLDVLLNEQPEVIVSRNPHLDSRTFFDNVREGGGFPYIYHVSVDDRAYYTFRSHEHVDGEEYEESETGVTFTAGDVLNAETLDHVGDSDILNTVEEAMSSPLTNEHSSSDVTTGSATDLLTDVMA